MHNVSSISQLQQLSEELKTQGYEAVRPAAFVSPNYDGSRTFSWGEYVHSMLMSSAQGTSGAGNAHREISTVFGSSGGENKAVPQGVGTPGHTRAWLYGMGIG